MTNEINMKYYVACILGIRNDNSVMHGVIYFKTKTAITFNLINAVVNEYAKQAKCVDTTLTNLIQIDSPGTIKVTEFYE